MNNQHIFNLSHIPERTQSPRENGLTMVMDKGLSLSEAESLVETRKHFIDLIKIGFGTAVVTPNLKNKIDIYRKSGISVYFGGTLFEASLYRNQIDNYLKAVEHFGVDTIEISDGSIDLPHDEKCELISKLSKDFKILSEVGSKSKDKIIPASEWVNLMNSEIQAGSWKVIAEARESGTVGIYYNSGEIRLELLNEITEKVPVDKILWEAPQKSQQAWFIKHFGQNVNLGNINGKDIIALEALRIGLRGDTFFHFLKK